MLFRTESLGMRLVLSCCPTSGWTGIKNVVNFKLSRRCSKPTVVTEHVVILVAVVVMMDDG